MKRLRSVRLTSRWPEYDQEQIEAAVRVLRSGKTNYWTGEECRHFEAEFSRYLGVPHAIALANGTVALELALRALGVGPGDEVVVPASTYIATASCVVASGAVPVFADIDTQSQTVTGDTLKACLSPRTRALIVVHLYGHPCPLDEIIELAQQHDLDVIEDCSQAHGARYRDVPVGSFGDAAAFSFCQDKIISTGGEGGMLLCRTEPVWAAAWSYKDHGKNPACLDATAGSAYRWVHDHAGTNWRMTEFQAAIGRVQLRRLDAWVARRQEIAALFREKLAPMSLLELPEPPSAVSHAWYRFPLRLHIDRLRRDWSRDRIVGELQTLGVPCGAGVCPELYLERSMQRFAPGSRLHNAGNLAATGFCLTMHHTMSDAEVIDISEIIVSVLEASRL